MTKEDIIILGSRAKAILGNEDTMFFLSDELNRIKEASFNTQPEEGKTRSELYYRHHALVEFIQSLTAYSQAADEVLAELEAANNSKEVN